MAGPAFTVACAVGRGLGVEFGVGDSVGSWLAVAVAVGEWVRIGVGICVGVAGPALLLTTVALGVAVLEHATTASIKKKIEPIRARRPVRTRSTPIIYIAVAP
jgi:hypothetical protein